jgi:hypothetical protein
MRRKRTSRGATRKGFVSMGARKRARAFADLFRTAIMRGGFALYGYTANGLAHRQAKPYKPKGLNVQI